MNSTLLLGLAAMTAASVPAAPALAQPASMAAARIVPRVQLRIPDYRAVGRPFRSDERQRHVRHRGFGFGAGLIDGWHSGYEDPAAERDQGFFAGPASAHSDGLRVHYDYDRGYPYDWYREGSARTSLPMAAAGQGRERRVSCNVEAAGVRVCRGQR